MNVKAYNRVLDAALNRFDPPPAAHRSMVAAFDVDCLALGLSLAGYGLIKVPNTEPVRAYLGQMLDRSLAVLWIACAFGLRATMPQPGQSVVNAVNAQTRGAFDLAVAKARAISTTKNEDYSPYNILKTGNLGLAARNGDKSSRIAHAVLNDRRVLSVKDEKLVDTAADLVNYSVYHLMVAANQWVTGPEMQQWIRYLQAHGGDDLVKYYRGTTAARGVHADQDGGSSQPWAPPELS